jgi:hypothetical protein
MSTGSGSGRFQRAQDSKNQYEEIDKAQRQSRKRGENKIESAEKSRQRDKNDLKRIKDLDEAMEEYD